MRFYRMQNLLSSFTINDAWLESNFKHSLWSQLGGVPLDRALRAFLGCMDRGAVVWDDDEAYRALLLRCAPSPQLQLVDYGEDLEGEVMRQREDLMEEALDPWRDAD